MLQCHYRSRHSHHSHHSTFMGLHPIMRACAEYTVSGSWPSKAHPCNLSASVTFLASVSTISRSFSWKVPMPLIFQAESRLLGAGHHRLSRVHVNLKALDGILSITGEIELRDTSVKYHPYQQNTKESTESLKGFSCRASWRQIWASMPMRRISQRFRLSQAHRRRDCQQIYRQCEREHLCIGQTSSIARGSHSQINETKGAAQWLQFPGPPGVHKIHVIAVGQVHHCSESRILSITIVEPPCCTVFPLIQVSRGPLDGGESSSLSMWQITKSLPMLMALLSNTLGTLELPASRHHGLQMVSSQRFSKTPWIQMN